jgi:hypothetical protein
MNQLSSPDLRLQHHVLPNSTAISLSLKRFNDAVWYGGPVEVGLNVPFNASGQVVLGTIDDPKVRDGLRVYVDSQGCSVYGSEHQEFNGIRVNALRTDFDENDAPYTRVRRYAEVPVEGPIIIGFPDDRNNGELGATFNSGPLDSEQLTVIHRALGRIIHAAAIQAQYQSRCPVARLL